MQQAMIRLLFMWVLPPCIAHAQPVPGPPPAFESAIEGARIHKTEHFVIAHDVSDDDLRPLTARLESTYKSVARFAKFNRFELMDRDDRLRILLFNSHAAFTRYALALNVDAGPVAGFYDQDTQLAVFCNARDFSDIRKIDQRIEMYGGLIARLHLQPVFAAQHEDAINQHVFMLRQLRENLIERYNRLTIQHETAHQVLFDLGVHAKGSGNPPWLAEGLATQFEIPQTDAHGRINVVNQMRLGDLRNSIGDLTVNPKITDAQIDEAFEKRRLIPFAEFFIDRDFNRPDGHAELRYAQAWAMVYFLHRQRPDDFSNYLHAVASRPRDYSADATTELAILKSHFGPLNAQFQRRFLRETLKLRYDPAR